MILYNDMNNSRTTLSEGWVSQGGGGRVGRLIFMNEEKLIVSLVLLFYAADTAAI